MKMTHFAVILNRSARSLFFSSRLASLLVGAVMGILLLAAAAPLTLTFETADPLVAVAGFALVAPNLSSRFRFLSSSSACEQPKVRHKWQFQCSVQIPN